MIHKLTEEITAVLSEEQMDYSSRKKIIEPIIFRLCNRIQNINSVLFEPTPYTLTELDITELLELIYRSASTKGQIYRYIENCMWSELITFPFKLNTIPEDEIFYELESNCEAHYYTNEKDRINQLLVNFCFKILDLKQKKQNVKIRRESALRIIGDMLYFYNIPKSYNYLKRSITLMDSGEQYYALEGFERYFLLHVEKIPNELLNELKHIFETTKRREIASTCLEIEMNVGLIEQHDAVFRMDDWKDKNRKDIDCEY